MNVTTTLLLTTSGLALAALVWWLCAWWYGRKLADLRARHDKLRQVASQQAQAARQQIAQLQRDLAIRPPAPIPRPVRDEATETATRKAALERQLDDDRNRSTLPAHGFADTQPL